MVTLYYENIKFNIGFVAGIKAFSAAVLGGVGSLPGAMLGGLLIGLHRGVLLRLFRRRLQGRGRLRRAGARADLPADRPARQARSREGLADGADAGRRAGEAGRRLGGRRRSMLKQAVAAGVITFLLASPDRRHRDGQQHRRAGLRHALQGSLHRHDRRVRRQPRRSARCGRGGRRSALIVAGGVSVSLLLRPRWSQERDLIPRRFLPFKAMIINWGALIIPAAIFLRVDAWTAAQARAAGARRRSSQQALGERDPARRALDRRRPHRPGLALPWLPLGDRTQAKKIIDICTIVLTYIMLGWGLNIVVGLAGLLDLGYVAFYAVGAYTYAMLVGLFRLELLGLPAAGRPAWRRPSASCWAFRCCGCAATIWPSSRSASAR